MGKATQAGLSLWRAQRDEYDTVDIQLTGRDVAVIAVAFGYFTDYAMSTMAAFDLEFGEAMSDLSKKFIGVISAQKDRYPWVEEDER